MAENGGFDLTAVSKQIAEHQGAQIPPVDRWNPDFCGDIDMKICRDGRWFYMGTPIGRQKMVNLFSRVLWREDGKYFLKTPVEKVGIEVEDAPFLFVQVEQREGEQGAELVFTSITEDQVVASAEHPLSVKIDDASGEPSPYLDVRFGMQGLINRNVFYQLVEMAELEQREDGEHLVIQSGGQRFSLGRAA